MARKLTLNAAGRVVFADAPAVSFRQDGRGITPTTNANLALNEAPSGRVMPTFLNSGIIATVSAAVVAYANSLRVVWPTSNSFVAYAVMRRRGGREFYMRDMVAGGVYVDQSVPDGEKLDYMIFGVTSGGTWTQVTDIMTGTQNPRTYATGPLSITGPGTYTGNYQSLDPSVPAIKVADGVQNYTLQNFRVRHAGVGVQVGQGTDGLISNGVGFALHPGVANSTNKEFINANMPSGITVEYVDFDAALFGLYVFGQATTNVKRIIFRKWRSTNIQSLKTDINGQYKQERGYAGHVFQANQCFSVPVYDVEDGEALQEPGVGLVEDALNNYISSGLSTRKFNFRRLCIFGLWPIVKGADPTTAAGYNYGCGLISDGIQPDSDDSKHGNGVFSNNLILASGNAGIGMGNGNDQEVYGNKVVCSGQYPDGTVNRGTNVGVYVNAYSGGNVKRTNIHDNQSMCWERPGSVNKNPGNGYDYNNSYDIGGTNTTNGANNLTYGGGDSSAAVSKYAQEVVEHKAWHSARFQAGTVIGAVSANLSA